MAIRVAINGLGRIGRIVLRSWIAHGNEDIDIVAVNVRKTPEAMAYYMKYDSTHGRAPFSVEYDREGLILDGKHIPMYSESDPLELPWKDLGIDLVMECTGHFNKKADALKHVEAGARYVLLSAPSGDADRTIVMGVNEKDFDPQTDIVVSNASCTTNSLAAPTKVIHDVFGIETLMATTIHAYTSTQYLIDNPRGSGRKGRAAGVSLVPASTGAAKAMIPLFPDLKGKMDMIAVRVPTIDGSLTDANYYVKKDHVTAEEVNEALKAACDGYLKGIVEYCDEEIVSSDIISNRHSSIIDALSTKVVDGKVVKVLLWYDNEYGYSNRMIELAAHMGKRI